MSLLRPPVWQASASIPATCTDRPFWFLTCIRNVPGNTQMSVKTKVLYVVLGLAMLAEAVVISHFFGVGMRAVASAVWGS